MKKYNLVFILLLTIFLAGCNGSTGETELQRPDKSPENLNEVTSGIDKIGELLDEIERLYMDLPSKEGEGDEISKVADSQGQKEEERSGEESNQGQSSQGEDGQGGRAEEDSSNSSSSSDEDEPPKSQLEIKNQKTKEAWRKIESTVEEIHSSWNEYITESQKKGVTKEQLSSFDSALNKMTISIENNDIIRTYNEIGQAFLSLSPIFDLYQDDIMGELTNLKHNVYKLYSMGISNRGEMSFEILENNDDVYNKIRFKLDDESKNELINRLESSVASFRMGLAENSKRLNMIKKNIVLKNITELEK